jgi:outer membrane protein assembly factor BamB
MVTTAVDTAYLWRQAVGGAVMGLPTVQAQSVVVVLDGGNVKAYSASGRPLWDFSARGRLSPYVTRSREGTSYICRTNGIFIAINRIGRELWRVNIGGALAGPVVLGWDGRVFIPLAQKMVCYTASGNLLWERPFEHKISAGPWRDQNGGILLALGNGDAVRLNHYGAAAFWRLPSVPLVLLPVNPSILALYSNGDAQLISMAQPGSAPVNLPRLPAPPLAAASRGANAAAALANSQLILMSSHDGKILWTADTNVRLQNEAAVVYDARGIYVLGKGGAAGFSADGSRLWYTVLQNSSGLPAFDDEGVLYSGGTDWILYAWKLEERTLKQRRTLYGPAPEGSYRTGITAANIVYDEAVVQRELEFMRQEIAAGRVGEREREWLAWLMNIAGGGLRQGSSLVDSSRVLITHRILALQLLSRIGSNETVPWLTRLFKTEDDPLVKAATARAIGDIGVDPTGIAINEFMVAAFTGNPVYDEQVLIAVAAATGALCRFSGPPLFDTGARILALLTTANHRLSVRQQARSELERLVVGNN